MAIESIAGYLASTRKPLDLTSLALDAFQTINTGLVQVRQQNLAEQKDAREAGNDQREGMQDVQLHQQDIMNQELNRSLAVDSQEMRHQELGLKMAEFGLRQEQAQWEQQNLAPLRLEGLQIENAYRRQLTDAKRSEMERGIAVDNIISANLSINDRLISGEEPVSPEARYPGEDDDTARLREIHNNIQTIKTIPGLMDNEAYSTVLATQERALKTDPRYMSLEASDRLMMPEKRRHRDHQRLNAMAIALPFSDQESDAYMATNQQKVDAMLGLDDETFKTSLNTFASRAETYRKETMPKVFTPKPYVPPKPTDSMLLQAAEAFQSEGADSLTVQAFLNAYPNHPQAQSFRNQGQNSVDSFFQPR